MLAGFEDVETERKISNPVTMQAVTEWFLSHGQSISILTQFDFSPTPGMRRSTPLHYHHDDLLWISKKNLFRILSHVGRMAPRA